jgi:hypothetical protein
MKILLPENEFSGFFCRLQSAASVILQCFSNDSPMNYSDFTVFLQWFYSELQWFYSVSPMILQCGSSVFTVFLQCFYSAAPVFLHLFIISQLTLDHLSISWATMNLQWISSQTPVRSSHTYFCYSLQFFVRKIANGTMVISKIAIFYYFALYDFVIWKQREA